MKKISILIFSLLLSANIFGQKKLSFEFDFAQFAYDTTSNYVELYFSFDQTSLTLQKGDTVNFTVGRILLQIKDTLNNFIVNKEFRISSPFKDEMDSKLLVTKMAFALKPGLYQLNIVGKDDIDTTKFKAIEDRKSVV